MLIWRLSRLAPRQLRRWAIRAVPTDRRLRVVGRAVPLPKPAHVRHQSNGTQATVRVGLGQRVTANVDDTASPSSVRQANLEQVIAVLEAGDVPYFRLPHLAVGRTALGVPERYQPQVDLLLQSLVNQGFAVHQVTAQSAFPSKQRRSDTSVVRVYRPVTDSHANLILGEEYACEVEFWLQDEERLVAPRENPSAEAIQLNEPSVDAPESAFGRFRRPSSTARYRTYRPFTAAPMDSVQFPIDVVYTWVDGTDPEWMARKAAALDDNPWVQANRQAANTSRFVSHDELRYSLRSLHCYAPWVRHIYLVTDDQVPEWLDISHPQITIVSHREIFGDTGRLPTFNSMAIESRLHRIPGLSEHFLYFNDDVFLGRPLTPEMFFTPGGNSRFFLSPHRVDAGPPTSDEPPVTAAGKNNRAIIEREFGRYLAYKTKHTPHAARRSVLEEIEQRHPEEVLATASHQFRHPADISILSSLQHYWAYATGRAEPGTIRYMYTDLADPATPIRLAMTLGKRDYDTFCLNDTEAEGMLAAEQAAQLANFLARYFPFRSPYERMQASTPRPISTPARQNNQPPSMAPSAAGRPASASQDQSGPE